MDCEQGIVMAYLAAQDTLVIYSLYRSMYEKGYVQQIPRS